MSTSKRLSWFCAIIGIYAGVCQAAPVQWTVASGGNDHWYQYSRDYTTSSFTWPNAKASAEAQSYLGLPGHLATITSQGENDFLVANIVPLFDTNSAWIGLSTTDNWATRQWTTGEDTSYTNWTTGAPFNNAPYAVLRTDGKWGSFATNVADTHIVEYEPVPIPAAGPLFGAALLALSGWKVRRRGR